MARTDTQTYRPIALILSSRDRDPWGFLFLTITFMKKVILPTQETDTINLSACESKIETHLFVAVIQERPCLLIATYFESNKYKWLILNDSTIANSFSASDDGYTFKEAIEFAAQHNDVYMLKGIKELASWLSKQ